MSVWERWAPVGGLAYLVAYAAAIVVFGDFPEAGDPAADYAAYYADERSSYVLGSLLAAGALGLFVVFAGALCARVRRAAGIGSFAVAVVGSAAYVTLALGSIGLTLGLARDVSQEVDPTVLKAAEAMSEGMWLMAWLPLALLVLAVGAAVIRSGALASWFGPASVVAAVLIGLGSTTWAQSGFWEPFGGYTWVAAAALFAWVISASVLMLRDRGASA